jgi:hypothetical protein
MGKIQYDNFKRDVSRKAKVTPSTGESVAAYQQQEQNEVAFI